VPTSFMLKERERERGGIGGGGSNACCQKRRGGGSNVGCQKRRRGPITVTRQGPSCGRRGQKRHGGGSCDTGQRSE
jgi:hypothetical protein